MTWRERLKIWMAERQLGMKELSIAARLGETAVRDILERRADPRVSTLKAIANALGKSLTELYDGEIPDHQKVPIIGCVSEGEDWSSYTENVDELIFRMEGAEPIALEVTGDSMAPAYRKGDLLIGTKLAGASADNLIGLDCIVMTDTGSKYVKYLARGHIRGRFNLRSYHPSHKDIENVKLVWVAPIQWVRRAQR